VPGHDAQGVRWTRFARAADHTLDGLLLYVAYVRLPRGLPGMVRPPWPKVLDIRLD